MGALCSTGFGGSRRVRVDCPLEFLWECIADLEHYPNFISAVSSVHRLSERTKQLYRGTRWRETRVFQGEAFIILKTVTSVVDHEKDSKLVSIHSGFTELQSRIMDIEHAVYTSTLVVTRIGPEQCELHGSFAAVHGTWGNRLLAACCDWHLPKVVELSFDCELNEIANEAVSRYRKSQVKERPNDDSDVQINNT